MKKWIKRIIWLMVIAVLVGGGYWWSQKNKQPVEEYVTEKIKRDLLIQTVEATGSVESAKELELNFKISGRVRQMNVSEGDNVKTGQIIANLEAGDLQSRVADAQGQLQAAQAELERVKAGSSVQDIDISQKTVEQRQQALEATKNARQSLAQKGEIEINGLRETALVYFDSELIVGRLAFKAVENVLTDKDAENTLGVLDTWKTEQTKDKRGGVKLLIDGVATKIASLGETSNDKEIQGVLDELKSVLDKTGEFLSDVYEVLGVTLTSSNLSETELDSLKTIIQTEHGRVAVAKTNINTVKTNWLNKEFYYHDLIVQADDNIQSAERALSLAESQLGLKKAEPRSFEIAAAEAKVRQAQASLQLAQANLANAIIVAPVDGVVTKVNNKTGEQTSLAMPVIKMVSLNNYEIEVDVPESDIAKIDVEQSVEITLDAFGDGRVFSGRVLFIEPAETVIQDVVYYKVRVQFNEYDQATKPGMTANVIIETNHKDGVVLVPLRAIKASNGRRFVEVPDGMSGVKEQDVKLGLRGDNGYEILSGLEEGNEVVVYVKKSK